MSNEVAVAIIGFAGVCVGTVFGYLGNNKKQAVINAQREQAQQDLMEGLKKELQGVKARLDKHNGYAEKFAQTKESIVELSVNQKNIQSDVASIKKDIEYLKADRCKL